MKVATITVLAVAMAGPATAQTAGGQSLNTEKLWAGTHVTESILITGGEERAGPRQSEELSFTEWSGKRFVRQVTRTEMDGRQTSVDTVVYDRATLRPVRIRSHNVWRGVLALDVSHDRIHGTKTSPEGEENVVDASFSRTAYHMAGLPLVLRSLDLGEGFSTQLPVLKTDDGSVSWISVAVEKVEWVDRENRDPVKTFVVRTMRDGQDGEARYWIAESSGLILKTEASWGDTTMRSWPVARATDNQ